MKHQPNAFDLEDLLQCLTREVLMYYTMDSWLVVGMSTKLMIERLRVWILAEAVGEFSSPELTLFADSYLVSIPPLCYHSGK